MKAVLLLSTFLGIVVLGLVVLVVAISAAGAVWEAFGSFVWDVAYERHHKIIERAKKEAATIRSNALKDNRNG